MDYLRELRCDCIWGGTASEEDALHGAAKAGHVNCFLVVKEAGTGYKRRTVWLYSSVNNRNLW